MTEPTTKAGRRLLNEAWDNFDARPWGSMADHVDPLREAAQAALDLLPDLSDAFHQVGSIRDHADPNDKTGWNVHGIETCADLYCTEAVETINRLRAALAGDTDAG